VAPVAVEEAAQEEETEELSDDLELVAVITAAIAASEGTSADGLVVRSIKRARNSQWKKA
jgi:predicted house-cleaning noncanonical NTP pyrophosphatase (MazG superfamily)